jgi:hypothetical protein
MFAALPLLYGMTLQERKPSSIAPCLTNQPLPREEDHVPNCMKKSRQPNPFKSGTESDFALTA